MRFTCERERQETRETSVSLKKKEKYDNYQRFVPIVSAHSPPLALEEAERRSYVVVFVAGLLVAPLRGFASGSSSSSRRRSSFCAELCLPDGTVPEGFCP